MRKLAKNMHPVDIHVGNRIKHKRKSLGLSLSDLGKKVNLSYQQIQQYEKGENRVSASVLFELAQALKCPVSYFFEEYNKQLSKVKVSYSYNLTLM
jgi:transcriptional regulator with XRE-family HTH domain